MLFAVIFTDKEALASVRRGAELGHNRTMASGHFRVGCSLLVIANPHHGRYVTPSR